MALEDNRKRVARKLCLLPLAGWIAVAAGGYLPTLRLAGESGVRAMALAQAWVAVVVFATLLSAMRRMVARSCVDRFKIAMTAGLIGFLAVLLLAGAVAWRGRGNVTAFLVWSAGTYVVMNILEAAALSLWFKFLESEKRC